MYTDSIKLLQEVGWEPLKVRRKRTKLIMYYKMCNHITPEYLSSLCPPQVATVSRYPLRNSTSQRLIRCRTSCYKNSFLPSCVSAWNNLDPSLRNSPSQTSFKLSLIKKYGTPKPPAFYPTGIRRLNILHTRLRLGSSALNSHLHPIDVWPTIASAIVATLWNPPSTSPCTVPILLINETNYLLA